MVSNCIVLSSLRHIKLAPADYDRPLVPDSNGTHMCEKIRAIRLSAHAGESIFIYRRVQELDFRERKLVEIRLTATKIIIMLTLNHAIEASGYPHSQGGASEMRAVSNTCCWKQGSASYRRWKRPFRAAKTPGA